MPRPFVVIVSLLAATQVYAQSGRLWTERPESAPKVDVPDFSPLAQQLVPAVVSIAVETKSQRGRGPNEFFFGPFGPGGPGGGPEVPREYMNRGLGSGFFISKDGLVLTNHHVVENAVSIEITYQRADGSERTIQAKVLGTAPEYDVALLQTEGNPEAQITYLGDSDKVKIGEWVMAVGNPFGLSHSVSVGIISAKERRDIMPSGRRGLYDFLQTDASINPGNSGGPLVNMRGEVIGINSAINAAGAGIGFAIPINMVKGMLADLKTKGKYARSWIGIKIQPLSDELAQSYGLKNAQGALVSEVVPESPAAEAGLHEGDIILEFDGKPVRSSSDLPLYASMAGVGKKVSLKVFRDKRELSVPLTLKEFPSEEVPVAANEKSEGTSLGIVVADITPELKRQFRLESTSGVIIREVEPGSSAERQGLRPGDVILSLNGEEVKRARGFAETVRKLASGAVMRLQVAREGSRVFIALRKP
jgi:serine protease Do